MGVATFEFSGKCPLRTTIVDKATGHPKYRIDTPLKLTGRVTKIKKFDKPFQPPLISGGKTDLSDDPTDKGKKGSKTKKAHANLPKDFEEITKVQWHWFSPDIVAFLGNETTRKGFLPRCGGLKRNFKFTGPDGVEYMWDLGILGMSSPKLVTADDKKVVIAQFYRQRWLWKKRTPRAARLEVQPDGLDMLDEIISTYVFAAKSREDREKTLRLIILAIVITIHIVA